MKVLVVDDGVPYPPTDGAKQRVLNLMQHVSRCHDVSLVSLFWPGIGEEAGAEYLRTFCTRVELVPHREFSKRERRLRVVQGVLKREPRTNVLRHYQEMSDRIRSLTENESFDIVDIQLPWMVPYVEAISPTSRCRKVLTLYDVPYVQYRRMMAVERRWHIKRQLFMDWVFLKRALLKCARRFDKVILVSELDRDMLKRAGPDLDIAVVPNGVDTRTYSLLMDQPSTPTLLFVGGMRYVPNVDGAIFFCQEVFPLIKEQVPDARFLIVGSNPIRAVQALASDDVTVTGYVEDVIPYYRQALVSVIPLRAGGGTRLKILESMALGRPVVSTSLGCEGLMVTHGENILIADAPADFAAQTVRLMNEEGLRRSLIANGRRLVETTYDWQIIARRLLQVYDQTIDRQ